MKPNLLVVQPHPVQSESTIDRFCETLCDTHYVYLIRPIPTVLDDSPAGVRFLNFSLDRLPGFGEVERVIVVGCPEIAAQVKETYPMAHHGFWNPESDGDDPFSLIPSLLDTIIQGEFGQASDHQFARAM